MRFSKKVPEACEVCCGDRGPNYALSDFIESAVNKSASQLEVYLDQGLGFRAYGV